jgi:hypothetical protein
MWGGGRTGPVRIELNTRFGEFSTAVNESLHQNRESRCHLHMTYVIYHWWSPGDLTMWITRGIE